MSQLIEGVDNEITLAFFLFTGAAAIAVPWYLFRPNARTVFSGTGQENANQTAPRTTESNQVTSETGNTESSSTRGISSNSAAGDQIASTANLQDNRDVNFAEQFMSQNDINAGSVNEESNERIGNISVKVKHNTDDMIVSVPKTMTLISFKRHCYNAEMQQGKNIRLIYNGRFLAGDHYSLEFLGINNGCVIHAQISEHQNSPGASSVFTETRDLDIGFLFIPLMTFAFILGWTFVVAYDDMFSTTSIIILSFLSVIFVLMAYVL